MLLRDLWGGVGRQALMKPKNFVNTETAAHVHINTVATNMTILIWHLKKKKENIQDSFIKRRTLLF